jgi:5'-nucleotidase
MGKESGPLGAQIGDYTMDILLTNDDGIEAPGLEALVHALAADHDITVVAPSRERSAVSQAFSFHVDYRAEQMDDRRYRVGGTPVDCVMFAVSRLGPFDLVISGINRGANIGWDTWYSGTVGAACEAARRGYRSISVSLDTVGGSQSDHYYDDAARLLARYLRQGLVTTIPRDHVLNINFPNQTALMEGTPKWAVPGTYTYNLNELAIEVENPRQWRIEVHQSATYPNPPHGSDGHLIREGPTLSLLRLAWPEPETKDVDAVTQWIAALSRS